MKTQYHKQARIGNIIGIVAGIIGLLMFVPLFLSAFTKAGCSGPHLHFTFL